MPSPLMSDQLNVSANSFRRRTRIHRQTCTYQCEELTYISRTKTAGAPHYN